MASLEDALKQKTAECEAIQRSFDDYVESSKELETELEAALSEAEGKIVSLNKKKAAADDKIKELTDKNAQLAKDYNKCFAELSQLKESSGGNDQSRRELEIANEDLMNKVRILEATEEDLRHKIANMEEDMVFLQSDLADLNIAKTDLEVQFGLERETLLAEIQTTRLMNEETPLDANSAEVLEKLKQDYADTLQALTDMNAQNVELKEELSKAFLEVYELQEKVQTVPNTSNTDHLEREIAFLNQQLDLKNAHIQDLLKGEECSELREMARLMDEKDAQLEKLQADIEAFMETSNQEKIDLVAEMSEKMHRMSMELSALRAESVSKSLNEKSKAGVDAKTRHLQLNAKGRMPTDLMEKTAEELIKVTSELEAVRKNNAVLLSKLQALLGNIQVTCRTRPPSEQELVNGKICVDVADDNELMIYDSRVEQWKTFMFDRVWKQDVGQQEVFSDVEPMIVSVADGYNACILAYGQTGSGKTYTMDGYADQRGVSYRTIQKLFEILNFRKTQYNATHNVTSPKSKKSNNTGGTSVVGSASNSEKANSTVSGAGGGGSVNGAANGAGKSYKRLVADSLASQSQSFEFMNPLKGKSTTEIKVDPLDLMLEVEEVVEDADVDEDEEDLVGVDLEENTVGYEYVIELSMMEIYNEQLYDLLNPSTGGGQSDGVSLDIRQGPDNVIVVPGMTQIAVNSIEDVLSVVSRGNLNRATASTNLNEHSSRSHLIIVVEVTVKVPDESPYKGKLHLVDLAGSERVGKSGVTGAAMKEAQYINKSLSALGDVMEALDQKSKHIPYRNSKLTYLLQNSLGGNSRTMMIVTVCPTDLTFDETLFTLQFATRVRNITIGPAQKNSNTKNLEISLKTLKVELKEMKTKRKQQEDIIFELKKEVRKVGEKTAIPDGKLKASEEAKKAAETLLQQATKQLSELNALFSEEKESKDQIVSDLKLTQRNLKKANDLSKEQLKEQERLQQLLKSRESVIEELNTKNESLKLENLALAAALADKTANKVNRETSTITPIFHSTTTPEKISHGAVNSSTSPNDFNGTKVGHTPGKELTVSHSSAWKSPMLKSNNASTAAGVEESPTTSNNSSGKYHHSSSANGESRTRSSMGGSGNTSSGSTPRAAPRASWSGSFRATNNSSNHRTSTGSAAAGAGHGRTDDASVSEISDKPAALPRKPSLPVFHAKSTNSSGSNHAAAADSSTAAAASASAGSGGEKQLPRKASLPMFSVRVVTDADQLHLTSPKSSDSAAAPNSKELSPNKKPPLPSFRTVKPAEKDKAPVNAAAAAATAPIPKPPVPTFSKSSNNLLRTSSGHSLNTSATAGGEKTAGTASSSSSNSSMPPPAPSSASKARSVSATRLSRADPHHLHAKPAPARSATSSAANAPPPSSVSALSSSGSSNNLKLEETAVAAVPAPNPSAVSVSATEATDSAVVTAATMPTPAEAVSAVAVAAVERVRSRSPSPALLARQHVITQTTATSAGRPPSVEPKVRSRGDTPTNNNEDGSLSNGAAATKPSSIGARSEDALKRHQERMEKKRLQAQLEKKKQFLA